MVDEQDQLNISVPEVKSDRSEEATKKNHYFDNKTVEGLVTIYVSGGCVDVDLRNEIMTHASELIKQVIKTHKLSTIYKGRDGTAFSELFQVAWIQIESALYKFNYEPGHKKIFNMWSQIARTVLLAHIKKESKDVKSSGAYRDFKRLTDRNKPKLDRFIEEAKSLYKDDLMGLKIIESIEHLYENDDYPHDGLIYKLALISGLPKKVISTFLSSLKTLSSKFSDSPENLQSKILKSGRVSHRPQDEDD